MRAKTEIDHSRDKSSLSSRDEGCPEREPKKKTKGRRECDESDVS